MTKKIVFSLLLFIFFTGTIWFFLQRDSDVTNNKTPEENDLYKDTEELSTILQRAKDIDFLHYEIITKDIGREFKSLFWQKGDNMRMEVVIDGQTIINLVDTEEEVSYIYIPASKIATKVGIDRAKETLNSSIKKRSLSILKHNPSVVGKGTIRDKNCLVIEYSKDESDVKMWIWEEYGIPIKIETETPWGKTEMEIINISFEEFSLEIFDLSPNVEITEEFIYF